MAMLGLIVVTLVWNQAVGITWFPSLPVMLSVPAAILAVSMIYATIRPDPRVAEIMFYLALWQVFPVFVVRLTYLSFALGYPLGFPLADHILARADAVLGFDWSQWGRFVQAHWLFERAQDFGYVSYIWQPVAAVAVAAIWAPRARNAEFFIALIVSIILTLAVGAFTPALGPAETLGLGTPHVPVIQALRAQPSDHPLPYLGIVSFPSFHVVLAGLFTYAHRGIRQTFPLAVACNLLMVLATPLVGDHYLVDLLGGVLVVCVSIVLARRLSASLTG
jgi:PAP2 superfamily protein